MTQSKKILAISIRMGLLLGLVLGTFPASAAPIAPETSAASPAAPQAPAASTNTIRLEVVSARTEPYWREDPSTPIGNTVGVQKGDPITEYKFMINVDNTGDPFDESPDCYPYTDDTNTVRNPNYPAGCEYPGIRAVQSNAPIVTQGDHTMLSDTETLTLPDGSYLITVISDDYKISGQWFTLPMEEDASSPGGATVNVEMQPYPLPTATIRVKVFEDNAPTNWGPDIPAEPGLEGFAAHVGDWGGDVTTDIFGNPICTEYYTDTNTLHGYMYDVDGAPVPIPGTGGECLSDENGDVVIPNMGTNRYETWVVPPDGTDWTQTTTLEGNKPWDTWVMEGSTGYDTEFVQAGENFPVTIFGFVQPTDLLADSGGTGSISGVVMATEVYVPFQNGLPYQGSLWGGLAGAKTSYAIANPWVALADLGNGDQAVYIGKGNADGSFTIPNVPDGDYFLSWWDEANLYILDWMQVTVRNGEVVDLGVLFLTGWFTRVHGRVFVDENENGKYDPGEHGINEFPISMRRRENSEMDRGATAVVTEPGGVYEMENVYPINQWIIMEAYWDSYSTTGVTFQAFNQPEETTILGAGVDIGLMPVIGQSARVDWGVKPYEPGTNGGIAGTVFYDTTRNEVDARFQAVEPWSVGIPDLTVNLFAPVECGSTGADCDAEGKYELAADGSYAKGTLLNSTVTESWQRPVDCQARDVEGNPVDFPVLPEATEGYDCLEPILMGTQVQGNDFATVDGNWGFGEACFGPGGFDTAAGACTDGTDPVPLPLGDYLVEVEVPNDQITGEPVYQVVREEDVNVFDGVQFVPQYPPSACAGALHTVDVLGLGDDGPDAVYNPNFVAEGGSPYEGQDMPLCDVKLVTVKDQRSVPPAFTFFTDVPLPGRHWGLILDDLTLSTNPFEMTYGEKAGIPNAPIGIYDFTNRLVKTTHSSPHGYFEVLLPSTETINAPSPTGIAAGMYYYVGNDPGQPGALNQYYNPQYRTIAAPFEAFPGVGIVADLAPTQVGVSIQAPNSQFNHPAACQLADTTPKFFAVDKVIVPIRGTDAERTITINGDGFGASQGQGQVLINNVTLTIVSWTNRQIIARVPFNTSPGPYQLTIKAYNGELTVNGVTLHLVGNNYRPDVFEVGPGPEHDYTVIQDALEAAADVSQALVVVYPGVDELWNPTGAYYENLVIHSPVKLQGVGPGGVYPTADPDNPEYILGSVVNGSAFAGDANANADNWRTLVSGLDWVGNQFVYEGAVMTVFAESTDQFTDRFLASIDGFRIEGGDQQGFPANINQIGGAQIPGVDPNVVIQGGGIFVNGYARHLQITNNQIQNNGGAYGGAIRLGTPNLPADDPNKDANNDRIFIGYNMILANGGTNLAGGVAIFDGSERYEVAYNDICGNFSAEYGGGISHYGFSDRGSIHNNRIYFNRSYDEGGGVMIAGELPAVPGDLSPGAGRVDVYGNIIQANLGNDDGGGLRFLMAGDYPFNVHNNFIVNNVSTHEGGGVSLNDAPDVRFYNNTVAKNLTTATAMTSTGAPAPAGLSTGPNSDPLQASLDPGAPLFSDPLMFNNIFWDNRAGAYDGTGIAGLGLEGDTGPINYWDVGLSDLSAALHPAYSILMSDVGIAYHPTNLIPGVDGNTVTDVDPNFRASYDVSVTVLPWRGNPNFVGVNLVAFDLPPTLLGDYHLDPLSSPAFDAGIRDWNGVRAYPYDIDGDRRLGIDYDIGADERGALSGMNFVLPGIQEAFYNWDVFLPTISK